MPEIASPEKDYPKTPQLIKTVCIAGMLGAATAFLYQFSELAFAVGQWYLNFLIISSFLTGLSLVMVWKMKKSGVWGYTITSIITQVVLYKYHWAWSSTSLIIPVVVNISIWIYYKKMK